MTARMLVGLSAEDYHADNADGISLNSSVLRTLISQSPLHAKESHPKLATTPIVKETAAMDFGTAIHAMLLGGANVVVPLDHDDFRSKAAREERDAARQYGLIPMKRPDWERAQAVYQSVTTQLGRFDAEPPLLTDGQPEVTIMCELNGVLCRVRADWLTHDLGAIDDIKTEGRSANPLDWQRKMFDDYLYHVQAQFYRRAVAELAGRLPDFRFIVVESKPPHAVSVISPSPRAYELADEQIDWALDVWSRCLSTGDWPGYARQIAHIDPPAWAESQWLDTQYLEEAA